MFPNNNLNQTAVYWSPAGDDGYGGKTWGTPIEIPCRWIEGTDLKMGSTGKEIISKAQVQVSQDLIEDGVLYLGEIADLTAPALANPRKIKEAFSILVFDKIPTVKNGAYYREAFL